MEQCFEILKKQNKSYHYIHRISDWRKGIAIVKEYRSSSSPTTDYYLIDKTYNIIYRKNSIQEEHIAEAQIERIFGGYYIIRDSILLDCRTYPGQDRDTDYYYSYHISNVLDENGKKLDTVRQEEILLLYNNQYQYVELGRNLVFYNQAIYKLSTYSKIEDLTQKISDVYIFNKGYCKFYVKDDFQDFYVIVNNKKIITYYKRNDFEDIAKITDENSLTPEKRWYKIQPGANAKIVEAIPKIEKIIHKYLWGISYNGDFSTNFSARKIEDWEIYNIVKSRTLNFYGYVKDNIYYHFPWNDIYREEKKLLKYNAKIPNYIEDIEYIKEIKFREKNCQLYLFKCRPYGIVKKDGHFKYDFDITKMEL